MNSKPAKPTNTPLEPGTLAKITRHIPADDHNRTLHEGQLIEIGEYISADEADDGVPFYWANSHGTGNLNDICVNADSVEMVKTVEQMNARRIPTLAELRDFLSSALVDDGDTFSITDTGRNGENGVEIGGKTNEGLPFVATIQITTIYEADF